MLLDKGLSCRCEFSTLFHFLMLYFRNDRGLGILDEIWILIER